MQGSAVTPLRLPVPGSPSTVKRIASARILHPTLSGMPISLILTKPLCAFEAHQCALIQTEGMRDIVITMDDLTMPSGFVLFDRKWPETSDGLRDLVNEMARGPAICGPIVKYNLICRRVRA